MTPDRSGTSASHRPSVSRSISMRRFIGFQCTTNSCCRLTHIESAPLGATMESPQTPGPQQQGAALMQRTTKYVALDVHQATTVAAVRAANRRVIARTILPTEEPALCLPVRAEHRAPRQ